MPDGDVVHAKLMDLYQKSYKELCEAKHDLAECAWALMEAFRQDLKSKGASPIVLAKEMGECLDKVVRNAGDSISVNRAALGC